MDIEIDIDTTEIVTAAHVWFVRCMLSGRILRVEAFPDDGSAEPVEAESEI